MAIGKLIYLVGDATEPADVGGLRVIVHCCNDIGVWGAGFVLSLSRKWKEPERRFRASRMALGTFQLVEVESDIVVCNLVGQKGVGYDSEGNPPIRYAALSVGLEALARKLEWWSSPQAVSMHMPRMGAGLAGGDWAKIEQIILDQVCSRGIDVYVYDLKEKDARF